mgnify:CR=1 FL=1
MFIGNINVRIVSWYGGIGRRSRFKIYREIVRVQVPLPVLSPTTCTLQGASKLVPQLGISGEVEHGGDGARVLLRGHGLIEYTASKRALIPC